MIATLRCSFILTAFARSVARWLAEVRKVRRSGFQAFLVFWDRIIYSPIREQLWCNMRTHESALFTPTEAAVLTRLSVKAVNNAIDKRTIPAVAGKRAGRATRLLDLRALVSLTLERRLEDRFVPELRRELFDALTDAPRNTVSLEGGFLKIDLRAPRRELATSIRELRRTRQLVISDPDIMGGKPVFRGTRVPVHQIATLLGEGSTETDVLEGYPRLTAEMVRLAPLYAAAYPLRGRPRAQPWHDRPPAHRSRGKLATIEVA
jgi:uncharacterized protein (DUF433 family)